MEDNSEESFWLNEFFDINNSGSYSYEAKERLVKNLILAGVFDDLFMNDDEELQPKRFCREGNQF